MTNVRRVVAGLSACLLVFAFSGVNLGAQTQPNGDTENLSKAEELFQRDQLQAAEKLFLKLAQSSDGNIKSAAQSRLFSIYFRWSRHDLAIKAGQVYRRQVAEVDDKAALRRLDLQLGSSYLYLGHAEDARKYLEAALSPDGGGPLDVPRAIDALCKLGQIEVRARRPEAAARVWERLDILAQRVPQGDTPDELRDRIRCAWLLADADVLRGRVKEATQKLADLRSVHEKLGDDWGQAETLYRQARARGLSAGDATVETSLLSAAAVADKAPPRAQMLRGDIAAALSTWYRKTRDYPSAARWREKSIAAYKPLLDHPELGPEGVSASASAYWKMQSLYRASSQFDEAFQLSSVQRDEWNANHLLENQWRVDNGALSLMLGQYATAMPELREAVRGMEQETPLNLIDLPLVWLYMAQVELANNEPEAAAVLTGKCLALYRDHNLPDDLVLVETYAQQSTSLALQGRFASAVDSLRLGVDACSGLGEPAVPFETLLQLNLAMINQAQGDYAEALRLCDEAFLKFQTFAEPNSIGFLAFDAARAGLLLASGRISDAVPYAERILTGCERHGIRRGPLIVTALHCQGLDNLKNRRIDEAVAGWERARKLQQEDQDTALMPRTLNYLGLSHEVRGQMDLAEKYYREAYDLEAQSSRTFPSAYYISHWRLAVLLDRQGDRANARRILKEGLDYIEETRMGLFGDMQQRATYFAQFSSGLDQLVEWSLRDKDWKGALSAITRGRSRSLMDQMLTAGVDPRVGLVGPRAEELLAREKNLQIEMAALRMQAMRLATSDRNSAEAQRILREFERTQTEFAAVTREIFSTSPAYRNLASMEASDDVLDRLYETVLKSKTVLLQYFLGASDSYLLVIGPREREPRLYRLMIDEAIAQKGIRPEPVTLVDAVAGHRGLRVRRNPPKSPAPDAPDAPPAVAKAIPVVAQTAGVLVDLYLDELSDPQFRPTRGLVIRTRKPEDKLPVQRLDLLGDVFLPEAARQEIAAIAPETLVVVPDGALHKLPLETLLLREGAKSRFVVDVLPPIAYAPSAAVLIHLENRAGAAVTPTQATMLTVADPAYPVGSPGDAPRPRTSDEAIVGFRGQLPRLAGSAIESARIQKFFDSPNLVTLTGQDATERAVSDAMQNKNIVHIAAHGFADNRFGNLFGALAVTPPKDPTLADNDGFLSLHEIQQLPLSHCELAVLSACETNVGPQQPLEAGVTLANAFLAAGANRVVASNWSVDDESTAELMEVFFREMARPGTGRWSYDAAKAMQKARLEIRRQPRWSAPFFWGSFAVSGLPR